MSDKKPVSKAQQKAVYKYKNNNYDRFETSVPKGKKEIIKTHAADQDESLNGFVNRAIDETMARDKAVSAFTVQPNGEGGAE